MRRSCLIALALLPACASHVLLSTEDRAVLERDVTREQHRFLRLSFYVTPFFGDASKRLLTPVPPEQVRLLNQPNGAPVNPGPSEGILPVGTRVRVRKVEFPTAWVMTERIPYTPRTQPWLYLDAEGMSRDRPLILVLRPQIKTQDEFVAEVERFLSLNDPAERLAGWSDGIREAIRSKTAVMDMPADALEMAWGYPEIKRVRYEEQVKKEEWLYPGNKRVAYLSDGRVTRFEVGP